jgi:hypothetical protein
LATEGTGWQVIWKVFLPGSYIWMWLLRICYSLEYTGESEATIRATIGGCEAAAGECTGHGVGAAADREAAGALEVAGECGVEADNAATSLIMPPRSSYQPLRQLPRG